MDNLVQEYSLIEYAKINPKLADYTYACCAFDFVTTRTGKHPETNRNALLCDMDSYYLDPKNYEHLITPPYKVLSIKDKACLMYECEEGSPILIWVCYTESGYRNNGYATGLLTHLKRQHPNKKIVIDTDSDSLRRHCNKIGIDVFQ